MPSQPSLPNSEGAWKRAYAEAEASEEGKGGGNSSASKIERWQFLELRVLWRIPINPELAITKLFDRGGQQYGISQDNLKSAKSELSNLKPWTAYINYLEQRKKSPTLPENLGAFALVVNHQQEVVGLKVKFESGIDEDVGQGSRFILRPRKNAATQQEEPQTPTRPNSKNTIIPITPTLLARDFAPLLILDSPFAAYSPIARGDSVSISELYPRAVDEQIVNTALIDFLQAITIHLSYTAQWTLHRKAFRVDDWEARVDGYLKHTKTGQAKAIVETKACVRDKAQSVSKIRMQEGAQMAA